MAQITRWCSRPRRGRSTFANSSSKRAWVSFSRLFFFYRIMQFCILVYFFLIFSLIKIRCCETRAEVTASKLRPRRVTLKSAGLFATMVLFIFSNINFELKFLFFIDSESISFSCLTNNINFENLPLFFLGLLFFSSISRHYQFRLVFSNIYCFILF